MSRQFDDDGRLSGWTLQSGATPSFGYDASGKLTTEVGAAGQSTTYGYVSGAGAVGQNNANHRVDITGPGQSEATTRNYYDAAENLTTQFYGGSNHRQEYYPDGRIKRIYNPRNDGWRWDTEYRITRDGAGAVTANQVIVTDPLSRTVTTDLNTWGLPTRRKAGSSLPRVLLPTSLLSIIHTSTRTRAGSSVL